MSSLDSYLKSTRPQPRALGTSQEVRDRGCTFIANAYRATTPGEVHAAIDHLKHVIHGSKLATHEIAAWRYMVLKHGRSGLGGPDDFELKTGSDDDGENWAGGKVLNVMQAEGVIDAVVIVSRW
jgi:putative IMPACT (imprinted ancient) family translation regulator